MSAFSWLITHVWLLSWLFSHFLTLLCSQDDYLVSKPVKQHLANYDKQLKKFNVSKALDTALQVWWYKYVRQGQPFLVFWWPSSQCSWYCRPGKDAGSQRSRWLSLRNWIEGELWRTLWRDEMSSSSHSCSISSSGEKLQLNFVPFKISIIIILIMFICIIPSSGTWLTTDLLQSSLPQLTWSWTSTSLWLASRHS